MDNTQKYMRKIKIVVVLVVLSLIIVLNSYLSNTGYKYEKYILTEDVVVKHNGKKVFEGNIDDYKLENFKSQDNFTMYMRIPKNTIDNPAVQYDNINTAVKIYVDGKKVFSIGDNVKKGGVVCHTHNKAALGNIKPGQELKMSIRVMDKVGLSRLPRVKLMNTKDVDKDFFHDNMDKILLAGISFVMGVLGVIVVMVNLKLDTINKKILVLSLLSLVNCVSILSTYQVFQIVSDNVMLDMYCEYVNRFAVLALASLYMYIKVNKAKEKRKFKYLTIFLTIYGIVAVTLQNLRIMYINDTLWFCALLMLYMIFSIGKTLLYDKTKREKIKAVIVIFALSSGVVLVTLFLQLFFTQKAADVFMYFPYVQVGFILIMYVDLVYGLAQSYKSNAEESALRNLAYMDKLTCLANRRGLEQYLKKYIRKSRVYKVYSFDLNGLKKVNDNYGHNAGDILIKTFSDELDNVFESGFCARMGGDEFVAIIENAPKFEGLLEKLRKNIYIKNTKGLYDYKIDFSVGSVIYNPNRDTFDDVLKVADDKMYEMKEQIKSIG